MTSYPIFIHGYSIVYFSCEIWPCQVFDFFIAFLDSNVRLKLTSQKDEINQGGATIWSHCKRRYSKLSILHKHMYVMFLKSRAKYDIHIFADYARFFLFLIFISIILCCCWFYSPVTVVKNIVRVNSILVFLFSSAPNVFYSLYWGRGVMVIIFLTRLNWWK